MKMEKLTGRCVLKRRWSGLVLYVEVKNAGGMTRWRKAKEEDILEITFR